MIWNKGYEKLCVYLLCTSLMIYIEDVHRAAHNLFTKTNNAIYEHSGLEAILVVTVNL